LATSKVHMTSAFSHTSTKSHQTISSTELKYWSLHHGPDVEPLSDEEKQGAAFTKMDKDKIHQYGPGDFSQYTDHHSSDLFDGGDSEMGLSGDGNSGLRKFGRDVSPHMTGTFTAQMDQAAVSGSSYSDELLHNSPGMDEVRAQQLENWTTQKEIAMANRYMNEGKQYGCDSYIQEYDAVYEVRKITLISDLHPHIMKLMTYIISPFLSRMRIHLRILLMRETALMESSP